MAKSKTKLKKLPLVDIQMGALELENLEKVVTSGWVTEGPQTQAFEGAFADFIGVKYAVATSSCTSALQVILSEQELTKQDEVITTPFTWSSTVSAILYAGATPVLADIDPETFNIDPDSISEKVNAKTKGIVVIHYAGMPCKMDVINAIAEEHNLFVVEDSAHALGSKYKGDKTGSLGDAAAFSFGSTKVISTGEGGMITTNNEEKYQRYKILKNYGETKTSLEKKNADRWKYDIQFLSHNYKINEFASAVGLGQMKKLPLIIKEKARALDLYEKHLIEHKNVIHQKITTSVNFVPLFYSIFLKGKGPNTRAKIMKELDVEKIESSIYYPPVNRLSAFKRIFKGSDNICPIAEEVSKSIFSVPCNRFVTREHIETINRVLQKCLD